MDPCLNCGLASASMMLTHTNSRAWRTAPHLSVRRVSHFCFLFFFASKRNEAKQKPFRFLFASFCETKKLIFALFRFVSLHFFASFRFTFSISVLHPNYYLPEDGGRGGGDNQVLAAIQKLFLATHLLHTMAHRI